MTYKLMSLVNVQIARLLGLVRTLEAIKLSDTQRPVWGVQVRGRGFDRLVQDDILIAPTLIRPLSAYTPRPHVFYSEAQARRFIDGMGRTPVGWLRSARAGRR